MMGYSVAEKNKFIYEFKEGNYTLDEYCNKSGMKEQTFLKMLQEEALKYSFIDIKNSIDNCEFFLIKDINNKENLCKIQILDCLETYINPIGDDFESIYKELLNYKFLILKLKFINLKHKSLTSSEEIFDKIFLVDEYQDFKESLKNNSLIYSNYGRNIGYSSTYERIYQPKVVYNITLMFIINPNKRNYLMAIKDYKVEGNVADKIEYKENETSKIAREKLLNTKCPSCGSNKIGKSGFKNGKQRYQCKECKRRFV